MDRSLGYHWKKDGTSVWTVVLVTTGKKTTLVWTEVLVTMGKKTALVWKKSRLPWVKRRY